jgi:hypothetical protein
MATAEPKKVSKKDADEQKAAKKHLEEEAERAATRYKMTHGLKKEYDR